MRYRKSTEFRVVISHVYAKSCEIVREEWRCHYLESRILLFPVQCLSPRIFADVRNSKKRWPSFLVCFSCVLDRDEKRWRAEERFRNSDMHSLHPHIRWCFSVRRSTIFDGARWTDGDFRLLFTLTRVRLFTFSIGFL